MQGRSIRSFALDYYRRRGADIRSVDGSSDFEIMQPDSSTLKVTFTDDATAEGQTMPLTATSPQWRAILEDLTAEVAVSYRYLTAGPIPHPAATLEAVMPAGWKVAAAKMQTVDHRVALGVTHRATFDSPALNACQELIFQHLWDVERKERILALEPRLYQTPAILLRPDQMPDMAAIQALIDDSEEVVDAESETHGVKLEKQLAELLEETENRINQYYDQQMGNVLAREVQISDKLDATIKKLGEARTPEQMSRYRQDGESLQTQLGHIQANRERELQAVEAACLAKIESERERHELTATIDLVALCHATFDVLTYRATVVSPDGRALEMAVRYWPLTRELAFPDCPTCTHPMEEPVVLLDGRAVCTHCTMPCGGCGVLHDASQFIAGACAGCAESVCQACEVRCATCMTATCGAHTAECATCEAPACPGCAHACAVCQAELCGTHAHLDAARDRAFCDAHQGAIGTVEPVEAVEALEVPETAQALVIDNACAPLPEVVGAEATEAPTLSLSFLDVSAPAAATAPSAPAPPTHVRPFGEGERVVSPLSGKVLNPRVAETCHACQGCYDVQEMHNCATCGVPACLPCMDGEMGPCPACASLEEAEPTDARLEFVMASFPALSRRRAWAIAELGPYVVAHWRRHGHWGMVVYHNEQEPVVLSAFSHGPIETAVMVARSWFLPRKRP